MVGTIQEYELLTDAMRRSPVVLRAHPLLPLGLPKGIHIVTDALDALQIIDDRNHISSQPMVILNPDPRLMDRFPVLEFLSHPSTDRINSNLRHHLSYARENLLTNHKIAEYITSDVSRNGYDIVVLLLIDGLSYGEILPYWGANVQPCFIDGVSVTSQFTKDTNQILDSVGFASIIGTPSIQKRLYRLNYRNILGFTYWKSTNNLVSGHLFDGIPNIMIENFSSAIDHLSSQPLSPSTYIQIMREGLDGLAHKKRELGSIEISASTESIVDDVNILLNLLTKSGLHAVLYVTADHGILWKSDHQLRLLDKIGTTSRYTLSPPSESILEHTVQFEHNGLLYYLYEYPYIGATIPKNHKGVHGGLSYQESIVPFARFEVKPKWN